MREATLWWLYTLNLEILSYIRPDVRGILRGEGWVTSEELTSVQIAVNRAHDAMDTGMPSMVEVMPKPWPTPPTFFKLNAFTVAFQVSILLNSRHEQHDLCCPVLVLGRVGEPEQYPKMVEPCMNVQIDFGLRINSVDEVQLYWSYL